MAVPGNSIPEVLKPRLRLFMSVDIVGSTALKQPAFLEQLVDWLLIIQGFYGETVLAVQQEWEGLRKLIPADKHHSFLGSPPQFWKTVGDEVLFYKEITDSRQVALSVHCWRRALKTVRAFFQKHNKETLSGTKLELDVKATLWLAGFPRRNRAIISPSGVLKELRAGEYERVFLDARERAYSQQSDHGDDDDSTQRIELDFIGPGIDIGFRLSGFSTVQKMIVSMDVAYMIARQPGDLSWSHHEIHYDGRVPLKGVFGGKPYPVFWLDNAPSGSFWALESRAMRALDNQKVIEFCEDFYKRKDHYKDFVDPPFVFGDEGGSFAKLPRGYRTWLDEQIKLYERLRQGEHVRKRGDLMPDEAPSRQRRRARGPKVDLAALPTRLLSGLQRGTGVTQPAQPKYDAPRPRGRRGKPRKPGDK